MRTLSRAERALVWVLALSSLLLVGGCAAASVGHWWAALWCGFGVWALVSSYRDVRWAAR